MKLLMLALAMATESASTYPIPPVPLRWLYREADLVAVVKPGQTESIERKNDSWLSAKVSLTIEKTLKGKAEGNRITVYYCQGLVCPAPDRYPEGKTLLVFLSWKKEIQAYYARSLSYATKELEPKELDVYLSRLEELSKIPAEKTGAPPSSDTLNWLVRCMEHPATRWEGAHEFRTDVGRRSEHSVIPAGRLSKEQVSRVVDAILAMETTRYPEIVTLEALRTVPNEKLDTFIARELRYEYVTGVLDWSSTLMRLLSDRLRLKGGSDLLADFERSETDSARLKALGKFLDLVEQR